MAQRNTSARTLPALAAVLAVAWLVGCGPADPRARVLDERARWNVSVLSWSQGADGTVTIGARLSGPPSSGLRSLTVRVRLTDAQDAVIDSVWHTFDLTDVERGGPADKIVRVPEFPHEVAGAGIDPVLSPSPEDEPHIRELQG